MIKKNINYETNEMWIHLTLQIYKVFVYVF